MRRLLALAVLAYAVPLMAQPQPPKLEPLPEPPPSIELDEQALAERGVKIKPGERAEEFTAAGKRVIRVTQPSGRVYYLIEQQGTSAAAPVGDASNQTISVPQWLIFQW